MPVSTTTRARSRLRRCSSVSSSMPRASVANVAVGVDTAALGSEVYSSDKRKSRGTRSGRPYEAAALPLGARDGFVVTHAFPVDGEYAVSIDDLVKTISTVGAQYGNRIVRHRRRQDRLRDEHRRRRGFANDRSTTDGRRRRHQQPAEGYSLQGRGRTARGGRAVCAQDARGVRGSRGAVRGRRRCERSAGGAEASGLRDQRAFRDHALR